MVSRERVIQVLVGLATIAIAVLCTVIIRWLVG
jgi:hypothetical protein